MKKIMFGALSLMVVASLTACGGNKEKEEPTPEPEKKISEIVSEAGNFTTLKSALMAAGLEAELAKEGPFTVLAPTDEAFKKLPEADLKDLLKPENKEKLKDILLYHVASGKLMAEDVKKLDGKMIKTMQGSDIQVSLKDGAVMLNEMTKVTATDTMASNGVIHTIDTVLMPPKPQN